MHSRYASVNALGTSCAQSDIPSNCSGGSARHKTVIDRLRKEVANSCYLMLEMRMSLALAQPAINHDITTIGNHEFDDGPELLKKYFPQLKMPVNPDLGKLFKPKPYHIFEELQIAIGYITPAKNIGKITSWEGGPVLVDYAVEENPAIATTVKGWQSDFEPWRKEVLGVVADDFEVKRCRQEECNFITDAILDIVRGPLINQRVDNTKDVTSTIQVSGLQYTYDSSKINSVTGTPVVKTEIQSVESKWCPNSKTKTYSMVSIDFVLNGRDNLLIRHDECINHGMLEWTYGLHQGYGLISPMSMAAPKI
ncbi:hypothetical protein BG003_002591 [Podila horticola]|nr:hypothetical protein BG003_002591 [Podila horticola]